MDAVSATVEPLNGVADVVSDAMNDDEYQAVEMSTPGPLFMRLQVVDGACIMKKFERDSVSGNVGEIERSGRVSAGDCLVSVNGTFVADMDIDQVQELIQSCVSENRPRILVFRRPATLWDSPPSSSSRPNSPSSKIASMIPMRRIDVFHSVLQEKLINQGKLRNMAATGIPEHQGVRGVVWRLLLRTLPLDTESWPHVLLGKRKTYTVWCDEYFLSGSATLKRPVSSPGTDDPLSETNNPVWRQYWSDCQLMEEIEKDVIRTHPDISFFLDDGNVRQVKVCMIRILYIFAKEHPQVRYVQGMNDLCGTLFYVFGTDESQIWRENAEADTYYCFENLVLENKDMFIKTLDSTETGIHGRIQQFTDLLRVHDNQLFVLFRKQGIDPSFYGLRWLTTLLCREFNLADTIRVWDALFADTDRAEFLSYVCCTMVSAVNSSISYCRVNLAMMSSSGNGATR
jgi:hypothetical protein